MHQIMPGKLLLTVRKVLADLAIFDFSQVEGNGRKFSPIELSYSVIYLIYSNILYLFYFIILS